MTDFHRSITRVAAKVHDCRWCREPIARGEKYNATTTVAAGEFWTAKWHPECEEAMDKSWMEARSIEGDPICDMPHRRGKTCEETPCGNAQYVPIGSAWSQP